MYKARLVTATSSIICDINYAEYVLYCAARTDHWPVLIVTLCTQTTLINLVSMFIMVRSVIRRSQAFCQTLYLQQPKHLYHDKRYS